MLRSHTSFEGIDGHQILAGLPQLIHEYKNKQFKYIDQEQFAHLSEIELTYYLPQAASFGEHDQLPDLFERLINIKDLDSTHANQIFTAFFDTLTLRQQIRMSHSLMMSGTMGFDTFLADYFRSHPELIETPESNGMLMISFAIEKGYHRLLNTILESGQSPRLNGRFVSNINRAQINPYLLNTLCLDQGAGQCLVVLAEYLNDPQDLNLLRNFINAHVVVVDQAPQRTNLFSYSGMGSSANNPREHDAMDGSRHQRNNNRRLE